MRKLRPKTVINSAPRKKVKTRSRIPESKPSLVRHQMAQSAKAVQRTAIAAFQKKQRERDCQEIE